MIYPSVFEIYKDQKEKGWAVTPEFLKWLEVVASREGVGANEAWNAALLLCDASESWLLELGELAKVYAVAHANLRVQAERGQVSQITQTQNDQALVNLMKHGQRRVKPLEEIR